MADPTPPICGTCIDYNAVSSCCTSRRSARTSVRPDDSPCRYWTPPRPAESAREAHGLPASECAALPPHAACAPGRAHPSRQTAPSPAPEGATLELTPAERARILDDRERARKSGAYWLTPEGRAELHETFSDDPGCAVSTLLAEVERLSAPPPAATDGERELVEEMEREVAEMNPAVEDSAIDVLTADLRLLLALARRGLGAPRPLGMDERQHALEALEAGRRLAGGHEGDEDSGEHYPDCKLCLIEGAIAHLSEELPVPAPAAAPTPNRSTEEVMSPALLRTDATITGQSTGPSVTPAVPEQSAGTAAAPPPFVIYDESAPIPPGVFPAAPPPEDDPRVVADLRAGGHDIHDPPPSPPPEPGEPEGLSEERLRELERLNGTATAGPWVVERYVVDRDGREVSSTHEGNLSERRRIVAGSSHLDGPIVADMVAGSRADAALLAALRTALPSILRRLRARGSGSQPPACLADAAMLVRRDHPEIANQIDALIRAWPEPARGSGTGEPEDETRDWDSEWSTRCAGVRWTNEARRFVGEVIAALEASEAELRRLRARGSGTREASMGESKVMVGPREPCALCGDRPDVLVFHRRGPGICERCARWAVQRLDEGREEIERFRAERKEAEG